MCASTASVRRAATLRARPGPFDEQRDLGQVVLVLQRAHARHTGVAQEVAERFHARRTRRHDAVGDVERQRVPAQQTRESCDARERALARRDQRRNHGEDQHPREQAAARRDHEGRVGFGERLEQALHGVIVFVVVEHDQPLRTARQELPESLHAAFAEPGAEAQREHFAQCVKAPCAGAEPVDAAAECSAQAVTERRGQHRLAAAAGADQRDARGSCGDDRALERSHLGATSLHSLRSRRKYRTARCFKSACFRRCIQFSCGGFGRSTRRSYPACRIDAATSSRDRPRASKDLISRSIDTLGSPASILATRD